MCVYHCVCMRVCACACVYVCVCLICNVVNNLMMFLCCVYCYQMNFNSHGDIKVELYCTDYLIIFLFN